MVKDACEDNFSQLVAELLIRIDNEGTVPTPIQNEIRIVWGVLAEAELDEVFPEDMEIGNKIVVIVTDRDGRKWLPLFTGRDELQEYANTNTIKDVPIRYIFEQVYNSDVFEGVMINPNTEALGIFKNTIGFILDHATGEFRDAS